MEKWTNLNEAADVSMRDQLNDVLDDLWRNHYTGRVFIDFYQGLIEGFSVGTS